MKEIRNGKQVMMEFTSMYEFYDYLCKTPINDTFRWSKLYSSVQADFEFYKTHSFDEAVDLMKNGWEDMSKKLTKRLEAIKSDVQPAKKAKTVYDVSGYQAIVPLYLNGVPTNMASKKMVVQKQKVITINKDVGYNCFTSGDEIIEESIKALQIVKKLEAQGYRVNLNIIHGTEKDGHRFCYKVRVKSAGEKLNISKAAFPLVNPSMNRRLGFRFLEVCPGVPKCYDGNYGHASDSSTLKAMYPDEYMLPAFVDKASFESFKNLDDLKGLVK